jgi:hypothetical protein
MFKRRIPPLALCAAVLLLAAVPALSQETTGALQGTVSVKTDKTPLPGVSVEAIHVPTGTRYAGVTGSSGQFNILNVRVGGPYTVTAKISGFRPETIKDVSVALGEKRFLGFELDVEALKESVTVTAEAEPLISPTRMGSSESLSDAEIKSLPTIRRQFQDFARTNPYVNVNASDPTQTNISVSGKNNRYNTIQIDGAVSNDLFGLAATGTPGGQTDTQPISLDTIQEIQVAVSPYDIKQGGFTGGAINAITRSGTNDFHGSIYGSTRNENWIGSNVPQFNGDAVNRPLGSFNSDQYGARVGGPILRDKLFFFASGERNKLSQPTSGSADGSTSNAYSNPAQAALFKSFLQTTYGYDPGGLGDYNTRTNSDLLLGKLDFNANASNNVSFRYNYVNALSDINGARNSGTYTFETGGYTITDKTNSGVLQLNSVFGADSFNQARVGYQTVRDNRAVPIQFPTVYICTPAAANTRCSGGGTFQLLAGTERSSGANRLDQDIFELTDDFTLIKGNHTITIGTHNEFFKFKNLFVQDVYGTYYFNTLADFMQKGIAQSYQVGFGVTDPKWEAQFSAQQWGLYVGDQWKVRNNLTVNLGLRFDLPRLPDSPSYNPAIFSTYGVDTSNVPSGNLMVSPRLGFNWNPTPSGLDQVRGGIGVFAGRTPFVWLSNNYGNTGVDLVNQTNTNVAFNPDINNPPKGGATAAITANGVNPDFKFPRVLRSTLGYDREMPFGIRGSVEFMFTKTLEDIFYYNLNRVPTGQTNFFGAPTYKVLSTQFSDMIYLDNTTKGEQQNLSLVLEKRFPFGLYLNGTYAYMNAKAAFEGTSSVAYSNWQFQTTNGDIYSQQLTRSFWEVPHRFTVVASENFKTGPVMHNVGFVFTAQSGQPYSILMGGNPNTDGTANNDLLFVPNNYNDVIWKGAGAPTEAGWNDWLSYTGLDKYRGRVSERNGLDAPWIHTLDFHYDITIPISVVQFQLTFDVLNLINLIDKNSGLLRYVSNQTYTALTYSGIDSATGKPIYTVNANALAENRQFSTQDLRSRYQLKLGGRVSF